MIMFVLFLAVLLGFAALSIDVGQAYTVRTDMQKAADAAALAGADRLLEGALATEAEAVAREFAAKNGYDPAVASDISVTVSIPPTSGPYAGDSDYVEVYITDDVETYFARVLGVNILGVSARAVAGINRSPKPYAIIALNKTACQTIYLNGTIDLNVTGGAGTFNNSECWPNGLEVDGTVTVDDATNDIVGGWQVSKNSDVDPTPTRAGHIEDPLAHLDEPTPPSAPIQTCPDWKGKATTVVLEPGVYDCQIDPKGSWGVQFLPGDYLITGGIELEGNNDAIFGAGVYNLGGEGIRVTGNGTVFGEDVTFYVYEGEVDLTGTGNVDLTAPDSGYYAGVLIFQSRTLTSTVKLSGNAATDGWGTVYALAAEISLVGDTNTGYQFISDTFTMSGNSNVTINFDGGFLGTAPAMRLVE